MEKIQLKILSYNIHKGFTSRNRNFVLRRMREAIRHEKADLVFLQEVLGENTVHRKRYPDFPEEPQFEYLADSIWQHFAYGKNAVYNTGHHGNAILSKYPITHWENIDVSTSNYERRGLLHAVIEIPDHPRPLHAVCVHLGLFEGDRRHQIDRLCERVDAHVPHTDPLVIAGDFNDWMIRATDSLSRKLELREAFSHLHGKHARTFPAWLPALRLDRIYFRGAKPLRARTLSGGIWQELSDHLALSVEMSI